MPGQTGLGGRGKESGTACAENAKRMPSLLQVRRPSCNAKRDICAFAKRLHQHGFW